MAYAVGAQKVFTEGEVAKSINWLVILAERLLQLPTPALLTLAIPTPALLTPTIPTPALLRLLRHTTEGWLMSRTVYSIGTS